MAPFFSFSYDDMRREIMFQKRLTDEGIRENPYYVGVENPFVASGYGMPNCTCYCYGRAWEMTGQKPTGLSLHNAKYWYQESTGFEKGPTPRLGAIACYDGTYGHIAVVEEIKANGDLVCSNSDYNGTYFYLSTLTQASGYNNYYPGLTFQGFIYVYQGEDAIPNSSNQKTIDQLAGEVIQGVWGNGSERKDRLTNAGYDAVAVQNKVNQLLQGSSLKPTDEIAKEVIRGTWGNGSERKTRLTNAGYDYATIQAKVNELLQ